MARYYRYRISFKSRKQLPWFMFYIEYFNHETQRSVYDLDWEVEFARVIYQIR